MEKRWINKEKGYGVFVTQKANTVLLEYTGKLITEKEARAKEKRAPYSNNLFFTGYRKLVIDPTLDKNGLAHFVNHSRLAPNLEARKVINRKIHTVQIFLVSLRPIEAGEELVYDYGTRNTEWLRES